jgi:hypothetical protein
LGITKKIIFHEQIVFCGLLLHFGHAEDQKQKTHYFDFLMNPAPEYLFQILSLSPMEFNIINYQDFYSGGGVSIGDVLIMMAYLTSSLPVTW